MPSKRALFLLGAATLLVAAGVTEPLLGWFGLALDLAIVAGIMADLRLARNVALAGRRRLPPLLAQGELATIVVELTHPGQQAVELRVREALHPSLAKMPLHETLYLPPKSTEEWTYPLRPRRRGRVDWGPLTVRLLGPLGLAWAQRDLVEGSEVRIYPRVRWGGRVGQLLALAQRHQLGQSPTRTVGEGSEPYALRTYRRGDPPRQIHWRASARHGRLISREETWERGARLLILLDAGRSMASTDDDRSKLDHSLAAALALLRLANGRGDRVTVIAYSDRIERRIRVRPGVAGIRSAYAELFDLRARRVESNHLLAVEAASVLEPRRSVAMLCTSVTDLATSERLIEAIERLRRRHQTLLVNLEDPRVAARAASRPRQVEEAFAKISAMEIQLANRDLARRLSGRGVTTVTTAADRLALETLDAYLGAMGRVTRSRDPGRPLRSAVSG